MAITFSKWNTMVAIPRVGYTLPGVARDTPGENEWGDSPACVSRLQYLFNGERSTVLLGVPSCFLVMTIGWHHVSGSP